MLITLARKPLDGTVAANVLKHGCGALNVDACRVASEDVIPQMKGKAILGGSSEGWDRPWKNDPEGLRRRQVAADAAIEKANTLGRWPANVLLGDESVLAGFPDTGKAGQTGKPSVPDNPIRFQASKFVNHVGHGDSGSAARYFKRIGETGL